MLAVLCLLASCSWPLGGEAAERERLRSLGPCAGVGLHDVRGPRPSYVEGGDLDAFPNDAAVCRALWLPKADRWFVPQGLALDGRTAWVSGYRWRSGFGNRPCGLLRVDLRTGRLLAHQTRLEGQVPDGPPGVWCHHGGGLDLDEHGLWVAETGRLWLVDPDRVGRDDAVRRVWRLDDPVSGGILVRGRAGTFGLGDFHLRRDSTIHWFRYDDVLDARITTLTAGATTSPSRLRADRTTVAPRYAQGGAVAPDGGRSPYLVSSLSTCGVLRAPSGRRLAFGPGAEGIAFDGRGGLWAVLEPGARSYQKAGRPLVPMLVRYDLSQLLAGVEESCDW